jgi:aspartyl-tRNA(Asn)/glutamyl-tRNA(Gln) amidotransferase subunit A
MTALWQLPAAALAEKIRRREVSPVEALEAVVAHIERIEPELNAFITVCVPHALEAAREAEAKATRDEALGPLHGVPFTVKDLVNTAGVRTTFGSLVHEDNVPKQDAVAVARLRAAGAILVGKTTTPEFGHKPFTEAPLFGRTRNAWAADRTSGGSSGGAAVAVAAGMAPLAVSTDGGGSTRIPAACNGVLGFKQSLGVVPHDQTPDAFGNMSYIGPTTRTVLDAALMMQAMAGPHPADPHSDGIPAIDFVAAAKDTSALRGKRIAWRPYLGNAVCDPEVLAAAERTARLFKQAGATVVEMEDDFAPTEPIWLVLTQSFWHARFADLLPQWRDRMTPTLVRGVEEGARYTARQLQDAAHERTRIFRQVQGWFADVDLIVTPTLTRTALPIDHDFYKPIEIGGRPVDTARKAWYPYTHPFNLTGHPAVTVPCGFARDRLPMAVQVVGRRYEDALVVSAARFLEEAQPWARRWPELPS